MSKPAKPVEPAGDQPPKSKKMLIIIIALVVLLAAGGGAAAFYLMKPAHPAKQGEQAVKVEEDAKLPPKFVEVGTFTANLMHEDTDRYVQVAVSLKLTEPELEEKIKARNPEIQNISHMLLQSKYPSQLATVEGKQKLASEIKEQVEFIMGLRKSAPTIHSTPPDGETQTAIPAATPAKKGIAAVLFTSFIIQ
jgi:flagellar FliL protein